MNKTLVIKHLKARYFELLKKEDFGATPDITYELDLLEAEIRRLINEG